MSAGLFPVLYPDELLGSAIARYQARVGSLSQKRACASLFGCHPPRAIMDLPCNIGSLSMNLPVFARYAPSELILGHTLYPFYEPFLPPARARRVKAGMIGTGGGFVHTVTGIVASSLKHPAHLRLCPTCLKTEQEAYGEGYWHRLHQACGLVCPDHKVLLNESTVPFSTILRYGYLAPKTEDTRDILKVDLGSDILTKMLCLAEDVRWVLSHRLHPVENFRELYRPALICHGFVRPSGKVLFRELFGRFEEFYGSAFLDLLQSPIDPDDECSWLRCIFRKHRRAFHPFRHLLVIRFLIGGPDLLSRCSDKCAPQPFGRPPWVCVNPASDHCCRRVICSAEIHYSRDAKKLMGVFRCDCGFVYSRSGPDPRPAELRAVRIMAFGRVWEEKLRNVVEAGAKGLRATAREMGVDARTVAKYCARLGLRCHWRRAPEPATGKEGTESIGGPQRRIKLPALREAYRRQWNELQNGHQASRTALRSMDRATYAWLYRNDKEWLVKNSPPANRIAASEARVDWIERDHSAYEQSRRAVAEILCVIGKPVRITKHRIGMKTGLLCWFDKCIKKLPMTKAYLQSTAETVEQYQIRRVRWAIGALEEKGKETTQWRIARLAGLSGSVCRKIVESMDEKARRAKTMKTPTGRRQGRA